MSKPQNLLPEEQPSSPPARPSDGPQPPPEIAQELATNNATPATQHVSSSEPGQKTPFYYKSGVIALLVIFLWPVGLALMWSKGCTWKKNAKIIVTIISCLLVAAHIYSVYKVLHETTSYSTYRTTEVRSEPPTEVRSEPLGSETAQNSVRTTTELLSSDDKSAYIATPLLSSPNKHELLSAVTDFEPQVIEGKGKQTIDMSAYTEPVLVTVDYDGKDLMTVRAGESKGSSSALLVNTIGKFHGTTTTILAGAAPTKLTVEEYGDSAWKLTISPLNRIPNAEAGKTYYQSQVLLVDPEDRRSMSKFIFQMTSQDATNSFEAYAITKGTGSELALESGKSYSGEAEWEDLPCILMVMTGGEWSFDIS